MISNRIFLALSLCLLSAAGLRATIGASLQMQLGNPSNATSDPSNHAKFLLQRAQYAIDYNDTTREANWVAWNLTTTDVGSSGRSDFSVDPTLPAGFNPVLTTDYSGSGYDRGHMCPSGDRTVSVADNQITFYMSNMVPQAPDNNQGVWANFESHCRTLAGAGNELLIISGPGGFAGSTLATGVAVPGFVWKIAVVVPLGPGTALSRITPATRVIAIKIPNIQGVRNDPWQNYITSASQIETDTGFTFFTDLPASTASALRAKIDGQTAVGAPSIVTQPDTQTSAVGGAVSFSVAATGDTPLTYQWLKDEVEIAGATNTTLTVSNIQAASAGTYLVVVTNAVGSVTSNPAALVVTGLPPVIVTPPAAQSIPAGNNTTLAVLASGSPTLTYQWRKNSAPLPGATLSILTLVDVQSANGGLYDVVVTNSVNSATSAQALLTVTPSGPTILTHPLTQTATGGTVVTLTVGARGSAPLSYAWRKGGFPLTNGGIVSGATSATLTLTGVTGADTGSYDVVVTNAINTATSNAALLTVNAATITWTFGADLATATAAPTSGLPIDVTGGIVSQGNNNGTTPLLTTTSVSPTASGFSGTVNAGAAARVGALNPALSAYFEFTLTPAAGKKLHVSNLTFGSRRTGTGPQAYSIFSSFDNFTTPIASGALGADSVWTFITPAAFAAVTGTTGASVTFRIFGHSGAGSPSAGTANWRIDDLKANVSTLVASSATAPAVTSTSPANGTLGAAVTTPISITFNQPVNINGPWFTISSALNGPVAATVTGGPTTFTLTPPTNFAFGDTVTVTVLAGQVVEKDTSTLPLPVNYVFLFGTGLPVAPTIVQEPQPRTVSDGGSTTFTVAATGTAPLTYQWRKGGQPIIGSTSASAPTLNLTAITLGDAGSYDCVVSNAAGFDTSNAVSLTVLPVAPAIQTQPVSATVSVGGTATFAVQAIGSAPLTYVWRRNGAPLANGPGISGVATPLLTLTGVQAANAGSYDVVVTNVVNSVTSQTATLGVTAAALSTITWDFGTALPSGGLPANLTGGEVMRGNNNGTTALLTAVSVSPTASGFSGGNNAGAAARTGALNFGTSAYFEFTLTPSAGRQLVATGLSFGARSTGTGPQAFAVFSNVDNFANPLATGALAANSNWAALNPAFAGARGAPGTPVTFRIFGYNGTGSPATGTANWRIDDLKLVAGIELPPAVQNTTPVAGASGVALGTPIMITFTQPVAVNGAWFTVNSGKSGSVAATATGGPTTFTLTPAANWNYTDTITVTVLASQVTDQATGTLPLPANHVFSFTTVSPVPPAIVTSPAPQTATVGDTVTFKVVATGSSPLSYQWRKGGQNLGGNASALTDTLTLTSVLTSDAGSYDCVVTNIAGTATSNAALLTVNKAQATVTLGGLVTVYNGQPKTVTTGTSPAGLTVQITYDGSATPPANAGSYAVVATIVDANYAGTATGTLTIARASATVTLGDLRQTYDGTPKTVSVTTNPAGLSVVVTYDGSTTPPVGPGAFAVVATINDRNYAGTAADTLLISITALVRHAPAINGGVDGSVQMLLPENVTLTGNSWIAGDLLVPGTPTVQINGRPTYAGIKDGNGSPSPSDYRVTLGGNAVLRYLVRRTDPVTLPAVAAPSLPQGTRTVELDSPAKNAGDAASLANLTLNGDVGDWALPPGAYHTITVNGSNGLILGAGPNTVAVYDIQSLGLNGKSRITLTGPVVITLARSLVVNGSVNAGGDPAWLALNLAAGGLTLNGSSELRGFVTAPNGTVIISGGSVLTGGVVSDRLTINVNGTLQAAPE